MDSLSRIDEGDKLKDTQKELMFAVNHKLVPSEIIYGYINVLQIEQKSLDR